MANKTDTGVRQLKNGFWVYRFCTSINGHRIEGRGSTDLDDNPFRTKQDAIRARKKAIKMAQLAPLLPARKTEPPKKTVREVFDEYCEKGRSDRAYQTIRKQNSIWNNHLAAEYGDCMIDEIPVAAVNDYLARLYYDKGYAYRYVESFLKMFYLIFGQAYSRGYLAVDVYNRLCVNKDTKIHMPKLKIDEDLDVVAFTNEECALLDEYFTGTSGETAYLLGRYCGLRINEAYGLKWENVNTEEGTIRIEQQMQYQDGLIKLVPLKTRNARRTIYLSQRLIAHFKSLEEQQHNFTPTQLAQREQNKTTITDVDGSMISSLLLVNTLPNGHIQTVNTMKYHTRVIKQKYGIPFKYHYLRHTYGTQLAVLNTPAHILCNQMGHGNIHVTEQYYIAVSKNGIDALTNNLEKL